MHAEARSFVARVLASLPPRQSVVEIGSRNINGTVRDLFDCQYVGLDLMPGPGVDLVLDAGEYEPEGEVDTVVCCEVLEHTEDAAGIVGAAHRMLAPGGVLILTCATEPRYPHSAIDGGALRPGEFYRNVSSRELRDWLANFESVEIETTMPGDIYAVAMKGGTA